jgi:hypothetical protein
MNKRGQLYDRKRNNWGDKDKKSFRFWVRYVRTNGWLTYSGSRPFFMALCLSCCFCLSFNSLSCKIITQGQHKEKKIGSNFRVFQQENLFCLVFNQIFMLVFFFYSLAQTRMTDRFVFWNFSGWNLEMVKVRN